MSTHTAVETYKRLIAAAQAFPCEKCGARVGEPCRTSGGNPTVQPHQMRFRRGRATVLKLLNRGS